MHPLPLLRDLLIVFAVAGVAILLFQKLRLPSIVGLLVAGMVAGPYGLSLIHEAERVETLAEVGVVVLLFTVGLEFSLPRLVGLGRLMLLIGLPQVLSCQLIGLAATWGYFDNIRPAILVGMLLAMSSTAIVFKLLSDRGELTVPYGNISAAVLLLQDLLVVVYMVVLPVLTSDAGAKAQPLWQSLGLGLLIVAALLLSGRYLIPSLLYQVVRTGSRELFLIVLVLLCLGSSALTAAMGWSLAMGAFLAGLALSESEYATQTLAEVLPFRDTLASLFFISVGMLLDLGFFINHLGLVSLTVLAVVVLKFAAAFIPALFAGYPLRVGILAGLALAQVGEFSFILADRGLERGLLTNADYQVFLAAAVLTIALTPLLIAAGPRLADRAESLIIFRRFRFGRDSAASAEKSVELKNHVVIIGYGLNGRNLARVLQAVDIEYVVLDLNPETVRLARKQGLPVYYGDCARPAVLEHLGITSARALVVAISDPPSTRRAVQLGRLLNRQLHIIVRTRYLSEVDELRSLGANAIIPEEFETSVEVFARVLEEYEVPRNLIMDLIDRVRKDHYEVLRDLRRPTTGIELPFDVLENIEIESFHIQPNSLANGRTIGELKLRAATGATLMAVRRSGKLLLNPGPDLRLETGDVAVLIGDRPQVDRAICLLDSPTPPE